MSHYLLQYQESRHPAPYFVSFSPATRLKVTSPSLDQFLYRLIYADITRLLVAQEEDMEEIDHMLIGACLRPASPELVYQVNAHLQRIAERIERPPQYTQVQDAIAAVLAEEELREAVSEKTRATQES